MTTYALPENGSYEFDPAYDYAAHSDGAAGSGSVGIEYRHSGANGGTEGVVTLRFEERDWGY